MNLIEIAMLTTRLALQTIAELGDFDLGLSHEDGDHLLPTAELEALTAKLQQR